MCIRDSTIWEPSDVRQTIIKRKRFGHKGTYGHVLLIGGCVDMPGAIQLSARGALKSFMISLRLFYTYIKQRL